ncbi:ABC transporter involved in cytochrome c biogenesis, ATPase component CcmA [hydrothermal vent metagenome]|uniref:ABC transporter involved in cytochrome c biogenesis, ATPase component CcmA n=1 Tax=hydrothermal vent metagenome TaxID=652676 RepID=A0A3B0UX84_9ZZZZ
MSNKPVIIAKNISCQRGHYLLFKTVSFTLSAGQSLLISGPNGIGKTTLLESIAGLRALQHGTIQFKGINLAMNNDEWLEQSLYIGHKTGNKKELSCLENLCLFLQIQGFEVSTKQAENALENVGLAGFEYQLSGSLSAGQKKRLALARLTLIDVPIWILDEPFVNLDIAGCDWLLAVLQQHTKNNGILIITAHDNKAIRQSATIEVVLKATI